MPSLLITPPAATPVTLADAKLHLRVDGTDEDALITRLIAGAVAECEHILGRSLMTQTWELTLDAFPGATSCIGWAGVGGVGGMAGLAGWAGTQSQAFRLDRVPVQSIASLIYTDTTGAPITLSSGAYVLDNADGDGLAFVVPAYNTTWPDTRAEINAVRLRYVAGYASAAAVPDPIKDWLLLNVGSRYLQREAWTLGKTLFENRFVDSMLDRYRVYAR